MVDYILSPCLYAGKGLEQMMTQGCPYLTKLISPSLDIPMLPALQPARRIVVYLPDDPLLLLITLQQAASLLESAARPTPMLILSRCPDGWLWHTLRHLVTRDGLLSKVRAIASDSPISCLSIPQLNHGWQDYPLLAELVEKDRLIYGRTCSGLSKPELSALLSLLQGHSISVQSKLRGVSPKTLYHQRASGLKKIADFHPLLASAFPSYVKVGQNKRKYSTLSTFEREFVHAINCRHLFPVFHPIVDSKYRLKGVEILIRWRRDGVVLYPNTFLPKIRSEYSWLMLTVFVLQEAIQKINQYKGEFYFSINIPEAIVNHRLTLQMMRHCLRQLHRPQLSKRLALEFSEVININQTEGVAQIIAELQKLGFCVMLDDCFSEGSVFFPVRSIQFNAFKLDVKIIRDMQQDPHALALIKSLHYYCELTESHCVAEGVDSIEKFEILKELGFNHFQGHFISRPMDNSAFESYMEHEGKHNCS